LSASLARFFKAPAHRQQCEKKNEKINEELASLGTSFGNKLLTSRKNGAVLFDNATELDGLCKRNCCCKSKAIEAGHDGKYLIDC
jgi:peptidyl-dipeptidase Dcp